MKSRLLTILTIFIITSCSTSKYLFNLGGFEDIGHLKVDRVTKRDIENGFKDVSPDHLISIGESIYPNAKKYTLATPKMYEKKAGVFQLSTDYYFSTTDSLVRVILYQWSKSAPGDQNIKFQRQFNQLRQSLTDKLGDPKEIKIEQKKFNNEAFRDGIKWTGKGLNAYLFMLGNDRTKYRQIRLAIYCE